MSSYFQQLIDINGLPLLACLAASGVLVYLGMHVVERKVIFVDLALAQIAALGVMWSILMGYDHENDTLAVTLYSLAFTGVGALIFSITRTRSERVPHEALIGIIYVAASAAGLVLADRFALGTEALKELIAGRVALVTPAIVGKLAVTCVVVAAAFVSLHGRLMAISRDPVAAEAAGTKIRLWDFLFYMLFGVLITQCVSVLGVLPVFAYLVIPAVAGAFLFESVRSRLLFGWGFAAVVSLVGLETARNSGLDPGPTIVCLFAAALVLLGVVLFLRSRRSRAAVIQVAGFAILFAAFLGGTLVFRKHQRTDELAAAIEFAKSGDPTRERQALVSFENTPAAKARWIPLVIPMVGDPDPVVRTEAIDLLGKIKASEAIEALSKRLETGVEANDEGREAVVRALRSIGDARALHPLVDAADREVEPDIAVEMSDAALDLAEPGHDADLRSAVDVLANVLADEDAPHAARREAGEAIRTHVELDPSCVDDPTTVAWWRGHREALRWRPNDRKLAPVPTATP
ncbi:MAG TPA: metal ABC transporter permease [Kofleriaceae bacterium]|nr:metal ABC transporter permease [Kofleriaceae bacterium]